MDDLEKSPPALPGRQPFDDEKKPFLEEIAVAWKNYFEPSFNGLLQPRDETLLRRGGGRGIWIYDELERDGHVYGLLQKRKMALIGREWRIVAASKSKQDRMAADIVDEQLMQLPTNTIFFNLLDAILKGYAVSEVMWEASDTVRVASIIARDQRREDQRDVAAGPSVRPREGAQGDVLRGPAADSRQRLQLPQGCRQVGDRGERDLSARDGRGQRNNGFAALADDAERAERCGVGGGQSRRVGE